MRLVLSLLLILIPSIASANLRDGLVLWLNFEEGTGTTAFDSSWKGNKGTLTGGPTWRANCARGNCINLAGGSDYVAVADAASLEITSTITIAAWINPTVINNFNTLVEKYDSTHGYYLYAPTDVGGMRFYTNTVFVNSTASILKANVWQHIVMTYNLANVNFYVNGVAQGTPAKTDAMPAGTNQMNIGTSSSVGSQSYFGQIDDFRIYNRVLTVQEIQDLYNAGIQIKGTGTKLNY